MVLGNPENIHRRGNEQSLLKDIAYFEARLEEMGYNGDCAYERAIVKTFARLVEERRDSLAGLRASIAA